MAAVWRWFVPERPSFYDRGLLALTFSLMGIGLMMVASASIKEGPGGDMFYFTKRHLIFLFVCLGIGVGTLYLPLERWREWSGRLLVGALGSVGLYLPLRLGDDSGCVRTDDLVCLGRLLHATHQIRKTTK